MHFSVEKSGKEVDSGQRFSHLKCIEFITYSQTTAAIPPAPPIATLAPYLFPGGEGSRFPMPLRCFDPPPLPPHILHCQQGAESGDDGTRYRTRIPKEWKVEGIPLSITFHRFHIESYFIAPCYGSFPSPPPQYSLLHCSTNREKIFGGLSSSSIKYLRHLHSAWIDIFENVIKKMERNICFIEYDNNIHFKFFINTCSLIMDDVISAQLYSKSFLKLKNEEDR